MDRIAHTSLRGTKLHVTRPTTLDLGDYLPYLVNRVGTIVAEQFGADALARHGLSIADWRVLAVLVSNGGQRQIDLADLTSIEASTLSRLVSRLMRTGLVTRTRSANSNREVVVKLSPKGQTLVARLIPIARDYEAAAIAGMTAQELAVLKRCLRRVYDNMKSKNVAGLSNAKPGKDRAA
jgi:MarR family transcriptional regulator, organic hydroperoxide resistance regulator